MRTNLPSSCPSREFATVQKMFTQVKSASFLLFLIPGLISWNQSLNAQTEFAVPDARLQSLKPENPQAYRDLAEECSAIENSQPAKDLTVRLYLICAFHSKGKLRRSALRGLVQAARNKREQQNFRALAYLQDPRFSDLLFQSEKDGDDSLGEKPDQSENRPGKKNDPSVDDKLLDALRSLRQGKTDRAAKIMRNATVQKRLASFKSPLTVGVFQKACESPELADTLLLQILELDSRLRGKSQVVEKSKTPEGALAAWRTLFRGDLPPRLPNIDFESISEFNPRESVYQNGVWRIPRG